MLTSIKNPIVNIKNMASQLTLILEYYKWRLSSQFKHVFYFVLLYSSIQISKKNDVIFFPFIR